MNLRQRHKMIILTGGSGFIGSNILKRLNQDGYDDILIVDNLKNSDKYRNLVDTRFRDLISKDDFYSQMAAGKWDHEAIEAVLHQGACTDTMEYDGIYMMRTNYEASKALLHLCLEREIKLVYASTAAVYGHTANAVEVPEAEAPLNIYGFSKLAFDNYVRRVATSKVSTVVGLRYFNVYGHGEQHKGRMSSMVYQFAKQIQDTGVARLFGAYGSYGDGESTRDFVSVTDLVNINMYFLHRDPVTAIVNAGSGVSSTWNQMAQAVIEALGMGTIEYIPFPDSLKAKYQFNTKADLTNLHALGYSKESTPLSTGVYDYISTLKDVAKRFLPSP